MHVQHEIVEVVCVQSKRSRRLVEDIPFPFLSRTAGWRVGTGYFHPVMKPNDPLRWNVCLTVIIRENVFEFLDYVRDSCWYHSKETRSPGGATIGWGDRMKNIPDVDGPARYKQFIKISLECGFPHSQDGFIFIFNLCKYRQRRPWVEERGGALRQPSLPARLSSGWTSDCEL